MAKRYEGSRALRKSKTSNPVDFRAGLAAVCVWGVVLLAGCGGSPFTPTSSVTATNNALVARYMVPTPVGASVYVEFDPTTSYGFQTSSQPAPTTGGTTTILVAGMKQNTTYHMRAVVTNADGSINYDEDHTFTTGTVEPAQLPNVQVSTTSGQTPAPGIELACLNGGTSSQFQLVAYDPEGNLIWYYNYSPNQGIPNPAKLLPNGHMVIVLTSYSGGSPVALGDFQEIDLAGNVIRQFSVVNLNEWIAAAGFSNVINSINHDIEALPNGDLLFIASETRPFNNLPGYPGQTFVTGSDIVEVNSNNQVVWIWSAFDHLDVNRHPMNFPDWTHANALVFSPSDGNLLFSLRHQNWVFKIDYQNGKGSGNILWRVGYQGDFTLNSTNPADWCYAQHDATFLSKNTAGTFVLGVFDNGNDRVMDTNGDLCGTSGFPACYSRSAIFNVDETNMTADLAWAYTLPYSYWGGVTQLLPNGNVYIDVTTPNSEDNAEVLQVTQTATPQTIWQMAITGQTSYRTINLPSLYPGVQW
jgi:hypothetical protein